MDEFNKDQFCFVLHIVTIRVTSSHYRQREEYYQWREFYIRLPEPLLNVSRPVPTDAMLMVV
jgi:uncharacterized protein YggT (Ycf19 family)